MDWTLVERVKGNVKGKRIRQCNSTKNNGVIHDDLLIEVLCHLPPKILMRCSCVCRGWYRLIALVCVPRITPSLPLLGIDVRLIYRNISSGGLKLHREKISYQSDSDSKIPIRLPSLPTGNPDEILVPTAPDSLVDSCNGLELYIYRSKYVLFNPTTKKCFPIPFPKMKRVAFVAVVLDLGPSVDIKIFAFSDAKGALQDLHVFSLIAGKWAEHKVEYEHPVDAATLLERCTYLDGKLFRLSRADLLLWYNVKDDDVNANAVSYDYIKLPFPHAGESWKSTIGSCIGRLHYAQSGLNGGLMGIWALSVDTREWILRHSISLQV